MNKLWRDLKGSWILFFYYIKWPILIGMPILYLELDYDRNTTMDILWIYSLYLVLVDAYKRFIKKEKKSCGSGGCGSK